MHGEARAGRVRFLNHVISQQVEIQPGCAVTVSRLPSPFRKDVRDGELTDGGDKWTVTLDVRDLGGHLDTTFRGWSATLASWVRLVIARLVLSSSAGFSWEVEGGSVYFYSGALHGIEASFLGDTGLRELRTAFFKVVWSRRQPLASVERCSVC